MFPEDHPRICGEHSAISTRVLLPMGSSPHMRGTRLLMPPSLRACGIIPAYAGNTNFPTFMAVNNGDHPRICGEHIRGGRLRRYHSGSSPHMRGTHREQQTLQQAVGIIPAYAGNTRREIRCMALRRDHPRICGEHAFGTSAVMLFPGSSPHMRGTLLGRD